MSKREGTWFSISRKILTGLTYVFLDLHLLGRNTEWNYLLSFNHPLSGQKLLRKILDIEHSDGYDLSILWQLMDAEC